MANVVTPSIDNEGNYQGSEIEQRSEGLWKQDQGYVQLEDGRYTNAFAGVELRESDQGGFDMDSHVDALREIYPNIDNAIEWAAQGGAPGFDAVAFNAALDAGDLDALNAGLDRLNSLYEEALEQEPNYEEQDDEQEAELDEWFDENVSDELIDETITALEEATYSEEQVEAMSYLRSQYDESSTEHAILGLGEAIATGQLDLHEALDWVLQNYSEAEAARAYFALQQQLN